MRLSQATEKLGWPSPEEIFAPTGSGPAVYAGKASAKIAIPFSRKFPDIAFQLGVVHRDPCGPSSEAPLAIACDFQSTAGSGALRELHRLCWNFCHAPILVVFEPGQIRVWDCGTKPIPFKSDSFLEALPPEPLISSSTGSKTQEAEALRLLNWVSLATGAFFRETLPPGKFRDTDRADRSLLENLKEVRSRLRQKNLSSDTCHDLLARIIFVQFLFDRKDSKGISALNSNILARWHSDGSLDGLHTDLESILHSKGDTYRLFKKLDTLFNGDLFPGKDPDCKITVQQAWAKEMEQVQQNHLNLLASLVSGKADTKTGQFWLWREYAFDTIPLEFISSIYEEFVVRDEEESKSTFKKAKRSKNGVVFTPGLLADFVLDQVLPWAGKEWDLSVLDPSCGSGIFLVKAFQRLVHRWRMAYPNQRPTPTILRKLLEQNIVGVDINPHAVRVASFSLYLAMMDELNPRDYLKRDRVRLPSLRKRRILNSDFFSPSWSEHLGAASFDIIVGNAPWGEKTTTDDAVEWASEHEWPIANNDIGTLFLPACEELLNAEGKLAMLQPAMTLLFNRSGPATKFRKQFFSTFQVRQVVNFSPVREKLFGGQSKAISPACLIVLFAIPADEKHLRSQGFIQYATVKARNTPEDACALSIDSFDIHNIRQREAALNPIIWTCLSWGGRRDLKLLENISSSPSFEMWRSEKKVLAGEGIIWGDESRQQPWMVGRGILEDPFQIEGQLQIKASSLNKNKRGLAERSRKKELFDAPQLLLSQSWGSSEGRYRAVRVIPDGNGTGVLCTQSFISMSFGQDVSESAQGSAWAMFNSKLAVYHQLLTSGRLASYRPESLVEDLLSVPIPETSGLIIPNDATPETCDTIVRDAFRLSNSEWTLVEDLFNYTLPDFKQGGDSPGRKATPRGKEPVLRAYSKYFTRVIQDTFGKDKRVSCKVWQEEDPRQKLGFRFISLTLDPPENEKEFIVHRDVKGTLLDQVSDVIRDQRKRYGSIPILTTMRFYSTVTHGNKNYPTIWIIKPDQMRYWTRSMGMRDADEVVADIMYAENPFDESL